MAYGFVYFLINDSMPGLTKVGMTTKHPSARMDELSSATACPTPFKLLAFFDTPEPHETERAIHDALEEYRVNQSREFFHAPPCELLNEFNKWCRGGYTVYRAPLDWVASEFDKAEQAAFAAMLGKD
jgi:hypothetical protein